MILVLKMVLTENELISGGGSLPTKTEDLSTIDEVTIKEEVEGLRRNTTEWFVMDHVDLLSSGGYEEFPLYSWGHRHTSAHPPTLGSFSQAC